MMEFLRSIALHSEFDVYSPGRYNIRHPVRGGMFIARTHTTLSTPLGVPCRLT